MQAALVDWYGYIEAQLRFAAAEGEVDAADVEVLAFELVALNEQANARSLLLRSDKPYGLAAAAMRARLRDAGAPDTALALLAL